jgi:hypothetical protein
MEDPSELAPEAEVEATPSFQLLKGGKGYKLSDNVLNLGLEELKKTIRDNKLDTESPKVRIVGVTDDDDGTDGANASSIDRYETIWKGFRDFCFLLGDYESAMLPDRDLCPANPFPVDRLTAEMYLDFRCKKKLELKHPTTHEPVLDVNKNKITTLGDWCGFSSVGLFRSAISKLHKHYDTTKGEYIEACMECKKIPLEQVCKGEGCPDHPGRPKYMRRGNPALDPKFAEKISKTETYVLKNNVARHTYAFLPGQLRDIRDFLLSTNSLFNLMLWTLIIVGIKQFERIDEVVEMTIEDFLPELFAVKVDSVEGLAHEIDGKRESVPLTFAMWDDKDCPEFSASTALLIWLAVSGIKSGPLFPTFDELKTRKETYEQHISYNTCLTSIKNLCKGVLKLDISRKNDPRIFGTHMLRKTSFLLAYWGHVCTNGNTKMSEFQEASILQSARHSDLSSTATYLGDAGTLKTLMDRVNPNDPRHRVGKWEPIHIKTLESYSAINIESSQYSKPLPELASWYVFDVLRVPRHLQHVTFMQIHRTACAYVPDLSHEQKMKQKLAEKFSGEELDELLRLYNTSTDERVRAAMNPRATMESNENASNTTLSTSSPTAVTTFDIDAPPSKKHKPNLEDCVSCERDYQGEARKARAKEAKVKVCMDCVEDVKAQISQGKMLVDPLRTFTYRASKVSQCVQNCHGNDTKSFIAANPKFTPSSFNTCSKGIKHVGCLDSTN